MARGATILVVDDEDKIVEVIRSYLEKEGYRVVPAYTGSQALELFQRHAPSLVVLDLMLPDITGEQVCRAIRQRSNTPILMLTARSEEESVLRGLSIGADDYVTKPFSPRQLVARVAAILRRVDGAADALRFGDGELVLDLERRELRRDGSPVPLTPNEWSILTAMARHPTKTFTREELIALALGDEFEGYDRVIDTHIKNLRQKLERDPRAPRWLLTVYGVGYRFGGGEHD